MLLTWQVDSGSDGTMRPRPGPLQAGSCGVLVHRVPVQNLVCKSEVSGFSGMLMGD